MNAERLLEACVSNVDAVSVGRYGTDRCRRLPCSDDLDSDRQLELKPRGRRARRGCEFADLPERIDRKLYFEFNLGVWNGAARQAQGC